MSRLEQLKEALVQAEKIVNDEQFATDYGKIEQDFFKSYVVELTSDIAEEENDGAT